MSAPSASADPRNRILSTEQMQRHASTQTWESGGLLRRYRGRGLRAPEREIFDRHADILGGRVLELGVGGGRLTGHLLDLGASVHGMDIAARMVAYCRRNYPAASFSQGDLHDASSWGEGTWDAIVAGWALIDVLSDEERATFFEAAHRLLNPGGLLIFSSHNLACATLLKSPFRSISADTPLSFASQVLRLPRSYRNHRRLTRWERIEPDYAILNGSAHDFSLLHYYITRDGQERQLQRHGFELLACIDAHGHEVAGGENALGSHELHYTALRQDHAPQGE